MKKLFKFSNTFKMYSNANILASFFLCKYYIKCIAFDTVSCPVTRIGAGRRVEHMTATQCALFKTDKTSLELTLAASVSVIFGDKGRADTETCHSQRHQVPSE